MTCTKQTAKKSNGGSVPRVNLKLTSTNSKHVSGDVEQGMEICKPVHNNGFCILCQDGSASFAENTLFMCDHCPRVMCCLCMELPPGTEDTILTEDVTFRCICCHIAMAKHGAPYYGFYYADGTAVLKSFLQIHTSLEFSSKAQLSAAPVIFIHLVLVYFETTASPFPLAHSFLKPYFTNGGIEYFEITYNIISAAGAYCQAVRQMLKALKNSFLWECVVVAISTHTDNDEGDPFAGYSSDDGLKQYGATATDDGCNAQWFASRSPNSQGVMWRPGPGAASCQSNALPVGGLILGARPLSGLQETRFMSLSARRHHAVASWTLVFRDTLNEHQDAFVAAKGNSSMRAHILKKIKDTIVNSETAKDPCIMLPEKNIRKAVHTYYLDFPEDDKDRKVEGEIIEGGHKDRSAPDAVTVEMVRDRENDKPEDAWKYKTEFSGFDVVQKLFKDEFGEYDKQHRDTSNLKSMGQRTKLAHMWHQAMSPEVKQELERVASKWNREGPPADTKDRYFFPHFQLVHIT
ncbi:hypothetical protein F4604DRAFT_1682844 [Suillus subluteus]|nr:hypothetical protein F4604DRAFT_1682844 [Suillus subluteus]